MRSMTRLPAGFRMFPGYLRDAGYYTSNNVKEDYNLEHTGQVWDESSSKAHWRKRKPDQPFFSVFNFVITHESQLRTRPHKFSHDPGEARIPAYHPDTPEVRQDWAQYYDNITVMDGQAQHILDQLQEDGLAENTIVFFYGDHGSGMPRNKRCPYNSGLQVPFIVHVPERWRSLAPKEYKSGGESNRLIGFIDLAPTVLSLAGVKPPAHLQGQAFMGAHGGSDQRYLFGFRGRMDERHDRIRSVRNGRYVYVRNFMPHRAHGEHLAYMFETPTTRVWKQMYDDGKLNAAQKQFWEPKPPEELFDLSADRDEVRNLAASAEHLGVLRELRTALHDFQIRICDIGLLPESDMHSRAGADSPYEMGHDPRRFRIEPVLAAAELASSGQTDAVPRLQQLLAHSDAGVRYWAATGFLIRGASAVKANAGLLQQRLTDTSPAVRIAAAEGLARYADEALQKQALQVLIGLSSLPANGYYVAVEALNALDGAGKAAAPFLQTISRLPREHSSVHERMKAHVPSLIDGIVQKLRQPSPRTDGQ